jgi:hypothetical protein
VDRDAQGFKLNQASGEGGSQACPSDKQLRAPVEIAQGAGGVDRSGKLECSRVGWGPRIEKPDIDGGRVSLFRSIVDLVGG